MQSRYFTLNNSKSKWKIKTCGRLRSISHVNGFCKLCKSIGFLGCRLCSGELFSRDHHQPNVAVHLVSTLSECPFLEQLRPRCNALCHLFRVDI